jgi:hypothetical protein
MLGDCQSKSAANAGARAVRLVEAFKYSLYVLRRDPWTLIFNGRHEFLLVRLDADGNGAVQSRELDRVLQQIDQHLLDPLRVDARAGQVFRNLGVDHDLDLFRVCPQTVDNSPDYIGEIGRGQAE